MKFTTENKEHATLLDIEEDENNILMNNNPQKTIGGFE